jgi:hypothetical protein
MEKCMKKTARLFIVSAALVAVIALTVSISAAQSTNVTGTWKMSVETQNGTGTPTIVFKQEGEELSGTYQGRFGDAPLKGTVKGKDIKFTIKVNAQGQDLEIEYTGTVDGDTMKGKVKLGDFGDATFSGKKE